MRGNRAQRGYGARKRSLRNTTSRNSDSLRVLRAHNNEAERELVAAGIDPSDRPRDRSECRGGPRPCPWVSCRHHLYIEVSRKGSLTLNFPDLEPWELVHSCSLDGADEGGMTLGELGQRLNLVRERIRQIEIRAVARLREGMKESVEDT